MASGLLESVTLSTDADYAIAAYEIPTTVQPIPFHRCMRSLVLHVLCGDARPLRITESKVGSEWFRARLSSSRWLWARVEAKPPALREDGNRKSRALILSTDPRHAQLR